MLHARLIRRSLSILIALVIVTSIPLAVIAQDEAPQEKPSHKAPTAKSPSKTAQEKSAQGEPVKKAKKKATTRKNEEVIVEKEKRPQLRLLGSTVVYTVPRRWTKPQTSTRDKLEALQFTIPLPDSSLASKNTSAIVVAEPNDNKLNLTDFSNGKLPRKYPASLVVSDQLDGDSWRTVISYVNSAMPPYTVVDRFGVSAGIRVHFRLLLPNDSEAKATWPQTLAQEGNTFIDGLRIAGKNQVTAHLMFDKGAWSLREGKAAKIGTVKESSNEGEKPKKVTAKKSEIKKTEAKKTETENTEVKKTEAKKTTAKKTEPEKTETKKTETKKTAPKPVAKKKIAPTPSPEPAAGDEFGPQ